MTNVQEMWCPVCNRNTQFYNVEIGVWQCDDCGHIDGESVDITENDDDIDAKLVQLGDELDFEEDFEVDGDFDEDDFDEDDFDEDDFDEEDFEEDFEEDDEDIDFGDDNSDEDGFNTKFDVKGKF